MQLTAALCNMRLSPGTGSDVWWDTLPEYPTSWPSERRWALGFLSPSAWSAVCPAAPASRCPSPDTGTQIVFSTQRTTRENEKSKAPTPGWHLFVFICATSQLYFHTLGWSWELHWEVYLEVVLLRFSLALLGVLNEETVVAALFQLHNDVQEARGAASGAFGESFVIPGQNPPGDIEEQMSMTEEKDRATAKETDVRKSALTCRTASAAQTCRRGGSAPPWQAETFPRLSWHGAAGKARGLCAGSDSRCPFPGRVCPQSPPTSQICSRKKKKKKDVRIFAARTRGIEHHKHHWDVLVRHEEVQQWPELFQRVLQWSAGDEESVIGPEFHEGFVQQGVVILQPVRLVHTQEGPVDVPQHALHTKCQVLCEPQRLNFLHAQTHSVMTVWAEARVSILPQHCWLRKVFKIYYLQGQAHLQDDDGGYCIECILLRRAEGSSSCIWNTAYRKILNPLIQTHLVNNQLVLTNLILQ